MLRRLTLGEVKATTGLPVGLLDFVLVVEQHNNLLQVLGLKQLEGFDAYCKAYAYVRQRSLIWNLSSMQGLAQAIRKSRYHNIVGTAHLHLTTVILNIRLTLTTQIESAMG